MKLTNEELVVMLRALYFYEDRISNVEEKYKSRDDADFDSVIGLRQRLSYQLKNRAFIS